MPHYKDGAQAHVGDQVVGKLYNTPGRRAGTIVSISPGETTCNAMVSFLVAMPSAQLNAECASPYGLGGALRMARRRDGDRSLPLVVRTAPSEKHGTAGPEVAIVECVDYCAVNELELIHSDAVG